VNNNDGSHIVHVPSGANALSDVLLRYHPFSSFFLGYVDCKRNSFNNIRLGRCTSCGFVCLGLLSSLVLLFINAATKHLDSDLNHR